MRGARRRPVWLAGLGVLCAAAAIVVWRGLLVGPNYPVDGHWVDVVRTDGPRLAQIAQDALDSGEAPEGLSERDLYSEVAIVPVWDGDTREAGDPGYPPDDRAVSFSAPSEGVAHDHIRLLYRPSGPDSARLYACGQTGHGIVRQPIAPGWYEEQWVDCDDFLFDDLKPVLAAALAAGATGCGAAAGLTLLRSRRSVGTEGEFVSPP